ncbi:hypothetical protein LLR08_03675 [Rouxiella badensis]|uniref:hypothetical protein n=1 Tax=Rouxiella badensis TaxID=1646377 RepID=UPI001D153D40|nr:hypothetical protein [Rouxiella badensis]MCC3701654.1 hypothetical protein [Rouxiella badensis]
MFVFLTGLSICALSIMFLLNQAQLSRLKQNLDVYQNHDELLLIRQRIIKLDEKSEDYSKLFVKLNKSLLDMGQRVSEAIIGLDVEKSQRDNQEQNTAHITLADQLKLLQADVAKLNNLIIQPVPVSKPAAKQNEIAQSIQAKQISLKKPVAPFILIGAEHRGKRTFAAIAPREYANLYQVTLLGEGESLSNWRLLSTSYTQAQFRVNGHIQPLQVN